MAKAPWQSRVSTGGLLGAGFFLFAVQPFKLGDKVAVTYATPLSVGGAQPSSWFEGTCEKVDLRCGAQLGALQLSMRCVPWLPCLPSAGRVSVVARANGNAGWILQPVVFSQLTVYKSTCCKQECAEVMALAEQKGKGMWAALLQVHDAEERPAPAVRAQQRLRHARVHGHRWCVLRCREEHREFAYSLCLNNCVQMSTCQMPTCPWYYECHLCARTHIDWGAHIDCSVRTHAGAVRP